MLNELVGVDDDGSFTAACCRCRLSVGCLHLAVLIYSGPFPILFQLYEVWAKRKSLRYRFYVLEFVCAHNPNTHEHLVIDLIN